LKARYGCTRNAYLRERRNEGAACESPRHRVRYRAPDREVVARACRARRLGTHDRHSGPGLLAVSAKRRGVSLASGHFPAAAGAHLVAQDLARWRETPGRPVLEITAAGHAKLKRGAAPEPEQFQAQHREVEEAVIEPHGRVKRNEAESPLAWLARRKDRAGRAMLDPASFAAGERFRHDFTLAGLQPRVTSDWSTPVSGAALGDRGMRMTDLMVAARQRLDAALEALGPELGALVIDVCGFLKGLELVEAEHRWPARSAKVVLGISLARLAAH